jgi:hypothetical protein
MKPTSVAFDRKSITNPNLHKKNQISLFIFLLIKNIIFNAKKKKIISITKHREPIKNTPLVK